jgi:hypothetical protein
MAIDEQRDELTRDGAVMNRFGEVITNDAEPLLVEGVEDCRQQMRSGDDIRRNAEIDARDPIARAGRLAEER